MSLFRQTATPINEAPHNQGNPCRPHVARFPQFATTSVAAQTPKRLDAERHESTFARACTQEQHAQEQDARPGASVRS